MNDIRECTQAAKGIVDALGRIVQVYAEVEGMKAENMQREQLGHSMAYVEDAFIEPTGRINAILSELGQIVV